MNIKPITNDIVVEIDEGNKGKKLGCGIRRSTPARLSLRPGADAPLASRVRDYIYVIRNQIKGETKVGKKLTIFLVDGSETGPRTIEIGNWSGKAVYSQRSSLPQIIERSEFNRPGLY